MAVTLTFDLKEGSGTFGKLSVVATGLASENHEVKVVGPLGTIRDYPGVADGTTSFTVTVDLPLDVNGDVVLGDYTVFVKGSSEVSDTFCLTNGTVSALSVGVEEDCLGLDLHLTDNSSYPTGVTVVRSWTVQHPVIPPTTTPSNTTSANSTVSVSLVRSNGLAYRNVSYQIVYEVEIDEPTEKTVSGDTWTWVISYSPTDYNQEFVVSCGGALCGEFNCIDTTLRNLLDKACTAGGINALPKHEGEKFQLLLSALTLYNHAIKCQEFATARYYKELIDDLNGVCAEATTPQPINTNPAYSSSSWVTIPDDQYLNGYSAVLSDPLQYRATNGVLFFRGKFQGNSFSTSGLQIIDSDYWDNQGIGIFDRVTTPIIDLDISGSPQGCVGYAKSIGGNQLEVYFLGSVDPSREFSFAAPISFT